MASEIIKNLCLPQWNYVHVS